MKISSKLFSYDNIFARGQMTTESAEILQISELSVIRGGEIKEHVQVCDEITYAVSGKARFYSGDSVDEISAGQIHFIRKGQYHKIVADDNHNFRYFCIGFLPNPECESVRLFLDAIKDYDFFFLKDVGNVKTIFELLIREFYIRDEGSELMIHFYLCQMFILLYRILTGKSAGTLNKISGSTSNQAVYRALKFIDREYLRITTIKEIAEELSYSEYYLSHIFKEKMNITIKDYLLQKKMITAIELLQNSNMTITEISEQLHFSSLHSFGIAFKRYTGMSASEFRASKEI